jgi:hypothetical protein
MPVKKRVTKKKVVRKAVPAKKAKVEKPVGTVTHFYTAIKVAIVKFKQPVKVGATIAFRGSTTDFKQSIASLQFDHKQIAAAPKNKEVGMKVSKRVREGDEVYIVT